MPSDFGDESGEKMVDWMLTVGRYAGGSAMLSSAEKLKGAFQRARAGSTTIGTATGHEGSGARSASPEWAKLSMADFEQLPEYESIKAIIDERLGRDAIEHDFFRDEKRGGDWLLFKVEDAQDVSAAFHELEEQTEKALDESLRRCGKTRSQLRDEESLEVRAKAAREASGAADSARETGRSIERFEQISK